jgi:hypothetical protein
MTIEEEYDAIFGEKHHTICEGKCCECHKEVKIWLKQALQQAKEEGEREEKERLEKLFIENYDGRWEDAEHCTCLGAAMHEAFCGCDGICYYPDKDKLNQLKSNNK